METFKYFFFVLALIGLVIVIAYTLNNKSSNSMFKKQNDVAKDGGYRALFFVKDFYSYIGALIISIVILNSGYYIFVTDNYISRLFSKNRLNVFEVEPFEADYFFGFLIGGVLTGVTMIGFSQFIKLLFEIKNKLDR